jgi:4-amino-4-deoxy-L-arabinose transferase-like glycosyltransferase
MPAPDVGGTDRWFGSAAFVFTVALLVAVLTRIIFPFDGLYGQDAYAYFRFARAVGPHLDRGTPLPFLFWPRGFPIAIALFLPLVGGGPAAGQIVSTLGCAWAAAATFLIVRDLEPRALERRSRLSPATAAGLSMACSGAVLRTSQLVMSEGLALGLVATAMLCAVRFATSRRGPWLIACAAATAGGAVTRWLVALLVVPLMAYLLIELRLRPDEERPSDATHRRSSWVWPALATLVGLALLAPQLWVTRDNPASIGNEWVVNWSLATAVKREFHTLSGYDRFRLPVGVYYFVRLGWPDYFFPTLALFAGAGLWRIVRERRLSQAALLLGWPLLVWLFLSGIPYESARFLLPTLPAIGALVGLGYAALGRIGRVARTWAPELVLILSLLAGLAPGANEHARQVARKAAELSLVHWIVGQVPAESELLMDGPTLAVEYYGGRRPTHTLYSLSERDIDALLAGGRPLFLLVDVDNVERQWKGLTPQQTFDRLRTSPGLSVVGQHPPYTLFAVHGTGR